MKTTNLVFAIIYTVVYGLLLLSSLATGDGELFLGTILMSGPLVVNWFSWAKWR